jgi:hypothetical protein
MGGFIRSSQRAVKIRRLAWLMLLATNTCLWAAENSSLSASTELSNEGYFVLNWDVQAEDSSLTLQQANSTQFDSIIAREVAGSGAATITGLDDGRYHFRLLDGNQIVSNTVAVTVQHHSMNRAGGFFLLGLTLFSILIVTIVHGNRQAGI